MTGREVWRRDDYYQAQITKFTEPLDRDAGPQALQPRSSTRRARVAGLGVSGVGIDEAVRYSHS